LRESEEDAKGHEPEHEEKRVIVYTKGFSCTFTSRLVSSERAEIKLAVYSENRPSVSSLRLECNGSGCDRSKDLLELWHSSKLKILEVLYPSLLNRSSNCKDIVFKGSKFLMTFRSYNIHLRLSVECILKFSWINLGILDVDSSLFLE
jgi:hypothetical protein